MKIMAWNENQRRRNQRKIRKYNQSMAKMKWAMKEDIEEEENDERRNMKKEGEMY